MTENVQSELAVVIVDKDGAFVAGIGPLSSLSGNELAVKAPFSSSGKTSYDLDTLQKGLKSVGASIAIVSSHVVFPRTSNENLGPASWVAKSAARGKVVDGAAPELVVLVVDEGGSFVEGIGPLSSLRGSELATKAPFGSKDSHYNLDTLQANLVSGGASIVIASPHIVFPAGAEGSLRPVAGAAKKAAYSTPEFA